MLKKKINDIKAPVCTNRAGKNSNVIALVIVYIHLRVLILWLNPAMIIMTPINAIIAAMIKKCQILTPAQSVFNFTEKKINDWLITLLY